MHNFAQVFAQILSLSFLPFLSLSRSASDNNDIILLNSLSRHLFSSLDLSLIFPELGSPTPFPVVYKWRLSLALESEAQREAAFAPASCASQGTLVPKESRPTGYQSRGSRDKVLGSRDATREHIRSVELHVVRRRLSILADMSRVVAPVIKTKSERKDCSPVVRQA